MLLMSRHLTEYHIVPAGAVIRINLAWEPSLDILREHLNNLTHHVFLDIPFGRKKPPTHKYHLDDILSIVNDYRSIKYLGVSQVETDEMLMPWIVKTPPHVNIIPKIESMKGINNIQNICKVLRQPKTIMLDHDDLFQDLCESYPHPEHMYEDWIHPLITKCAKMHVSILRTAGVVFHTG